MGIRIDGNNDLIKAVDDTLTIEGISVNTSGMVTATGGVKVGTAATIHSTGQFNIGVAHTLFANGNATHSGIVTASSFVGDGSGLTNAGPSLTGSTNNTIVTVTGANAIQGESGLTFDGSTLNLSAASSNAGRISVFGAEGQDARLSLIADEGDDHIDQYGLRSAASDNRFYIEHFESGAFQERFTIKNGGDVGINTNNPVVKLDISEDRVSFPTPAGSTILRLRNSAGSATLSIDAGASSSSAIQFGDTAAASVGTIQYSHSTNHLQFNTNGDGEKMRITSGGVVQIGGETANSADIDTSNSKLTIKQSANSAEDGIYLERSGERRGHYIYVGGGLSQSDALCVTTNQLGTDTDLLAIDRGGDIAVGAGDIFFGTSGKGIVLGATSNTDANTLDDYEEGSWTPGFYPMSSAMTLSYDLQTGSYVKIGRVCYWAFRVRLSGLSGQMGQNMGFGGFPFNVDNSQPQFSANIYGQNYNGEIPDGIFYQGNVNRGDLYYPTNADGATRAVLQASDCNPTNSYTVGTGFFFVA